MNKKLIFSNLGLRIYRIFGSPYDFEIEQPQSNGDLITFKTCDNARLTMWLFHSGICTDRLKALDLINYGKQL